MRLFFFPINYFLFSLLADRHFFAICLSSSCYLELRCEVWKNNNYIETNQKNCRDVGHNIHEVLNESLHMGCPTLGSYQIPELHVLLGTTRSLHLYSSISRGIVESRVGGKGLTTCRLVHFSFTNTNLKWVLSATQESDYIFFSYE